MKKNITAVAPYWRCPHRSLLARQKTINRGTRLIGGTSVNVVSYHAVLDRKSRNDTYLEYEAFAKRLV